MKELIYEILSFVITIFLFYNGEKGLIERNENSKEEKNKLDSLHILSERIRIGVRILVIYFITKTLLKIIYLAIKSLLYFIF